MAKQHWRLISIGKREYHQNNKEKKEKNWISSKYMLFLNFLLVLKYELFLLARTFYVFWVWRFNIWMNQLYYVTWHLFNMSIWYPIGYDRVSYRVIKRSYGGRLFAQMLCLINSCPSSQTILNIQWKIQFSHSIRS